MMTRLAPHMRRPGGGFWGWLALRLMRRRMRAMNEWAVGMLDIQPADHVLEIAFGAGDSIARVAARAPDGFVAGVDVSDYAVKVATRRNRAAIRAGRVALHQGDAAQVPYEDNSFDKAFCCGAIYYFPDASGMAREVWRVLKPGGAYVILVRTPEALLANPAFRKNGHRTYSRDELSALLREAGFARFEALRDPPQSTLIGMRGVK